MYCISLYIWRKNVRSGNIHSAEIPKKLYRANTTCPLTHQHNPFFATGSLEDTYIRYP